MTLAIGILSCGFLFLTAHSLQAAPGIHETINFQGKLVDSTGLNVADSSYSIVFTLYDAASGGSSLWTETRSVATVDGIFREELGTTSSLSGVDFNSDSIYLGIKVGADAEMTPRVRFTATPYAFQAKKVPWSGLQDAAANTAIAMGSYTSTLTYGNATSTANLFNLTDTASNTGTGYLLNLTTATSSTLKPFRVAAAGTEAIMVDANGNVGIGTTAPGAKVESRSTTEQLRLSYDSASPVKFTVDSAGSMTIDASKLGNNFLRFKVSGASNPSAEVLTIKGTSGAKGFIGINNSSPSFDLDVTGQGRFSTGSIFSGTNPSTSTRNSLYIDSTTIQSMRDNGNVNSRELAKIVNNWLVSTQGSEQGLTSFYVARPNTTSATDLDEVMRLVGGNSSTTKGRVGIGTTTPVSTLDVAGTTWLRGGTGNTSGLFVDASGNVGIGTTAPGYKLDVNGDIRIASGSELYSNGSATLGSRTYTEQNYVANAQTFTTSIDALDMQVADIVAGAGGVWTLSAGKLYPTTISNTIGLGTTNPLGRLNIQGAGTTTGFSLLTQDSAGAHKFAVLDNGNVGIGTTAPGERVTIYGNLNFSNNSTTSIYNNNSSGGLKLQAAQNGGGGSTLHLNGNSFEFGSHTGVFNYYRDRTGTTSSPGYRLQIGLGHAYASWSPVNAAGGVFVFENSNVGIGTTAPGYKLEVNGTGYFGSTLTLGNSSDITSFGSTTLGNRTYTEQNYITNAQTFTASIDALDIQVADIVAGAGGVWTLSAGKLYPTTISNTIGLGTTNPLGRLNIQGAGTTTGFSLLTQDSAGAHKFAILDNGNVGIGTTAPTSSFSVGASSEFQVNSTGNIVKINNVTTSFPVSQGAANSTLQNDGSGNLSWADPTGTGVIGYFQRNGTTLTPTTATDNLTIGSTTNTSAMLYVPGTTNNDAWINLGTGKLGIGTTSPNAKLDIFGTSAAMQLSYDTSNYNKLSIGSDGTLTMAGVSAGGGLTTISRYSSSQVNFDVPTAFNAAGDVSMAYDLIMANQTSSQIESYGPLSIISGEAFENNNLTLKTYGTGKLIIDSSNIWADGSNVGIGTTGPTAKLHVYDNTASPVIKLDTATSTYDPEFALAYAGNTYGQFYRDSGTGSINLTALQSGYDLNFTTTGAGDFIFNNGNVGIGTTAPGFTLDVSGSAAQVQARIQNAQANSQSALILENDAKRFDLQVINNGTNDDFRIRDVSLGADRFAITDAGNVGIGTTAPIRKLQVDSTSGSTLTPFLNFQSTDVATGGGSAIDFKTSTNTTVDRYLARIGGVRSAVNNGSSDFVIYTDNVAGDALAERMRVLYNGNVGIGTTAPGYKLHVAGTNPVLAIDGGDAGAVNSIFFRENVDTGMKINYNGSISGSLDRLEFMDRSSGVDTARMVIQRNGNVGIGTTDPGEKLEVAGNLKLNNGASQTILRMASTSNSLMYFADGATDEWYAGRTDATNRFDIAESGVGTWFSIIPGGNVGIGTTAPSQKLEIAGNLLSSIAGGGNFFQLRNPSTGNDWIFMHNEGKLHIQYEQAVGYEIMTLQNNGNVGIGTTAPGATLDVSNATPVIRISDTTNSDAWALNTTMGVLEFYTTDTTSPGARVTTSIAQITDWNGSHTVPRGALQFNVSTTASVSEAMRISSGGNVGIGSTNPGSNKLKIVGSLCVKSTDAACAGSTAGTIYATTTTVAAADYAEYFKTKDTDLVSGEAVCIDSSEANSVKRCTQAEETNIMGIVSTQPAVLGNATNETINNPNYKAIAMLGQIPAKVSNENGQIKIGDSLTAASTPGYIMKANPGDSTVGVALESFGLNPTSNVQSPTSNTGTIQVMISRKNKSITVESVEAKVTERIAAMKIEDEVNRLVSEAVSALMPKSNLVLNENGELVDVVMQQAQQSILDQGMVISQINLEKNVIQQSIDTLSQIYDALSQQVIAIEDKVNEAQSNIESLDARVSALEQYFATDSAIFFQPQNASASAMIARSITDTEVIFDKNLISEADLTVLGKLSAGDISSIGTISNGLLTINGFNDELATASATITTFGGPLHLQHDGANPVEIMGGKVGIDTDGNVQVRDGSVEIAKNNLSIQTGSIKGSESIRGIDIAVPVGTTTYDVVFTTPNDTNSYAVSVTPTWFTSTLIQNKTTTGFTIRFNQSAPTGGKIDWIVIE